MAKRNGKNDNGHNPYHHLHEDLRRDFVLKNTPQILAALIIRRAASPGDTLVSLAIDLAEQIYNSVHDLPPIAETEVLHQLV